MKIDRKLCLELEDILFKNERMESLITCVQMLISEGVVEVAGVPDNCLDYSLYDILEGMRENNENIRTIIDKAELIRE